MEQWKDVTQMIDPGVILHLQSHHDAAPNRGDDVPQATVLIIDDEEAVRETLLEALSFHGYRVLTAASVQEAEDIKQRVGVGAIHVVVADIHLTPGPQARAGYALAQRWRALHPQLPFILMSGDSSNQDLPDIRAGAVRFLVKPFRIAVFLDAVRDALGR
jgi:DNA-binding NtrC family response regulator